MSKNFLMDLMLIVSLLLLVSGNAQVVTSNLEAS